jgi:hypothetical protein
MLLSLESLPIKNSLHAQTQASPSSSLTISQTLTLDSNPIVVSCLLQQPHEAYSTKAPKTTTKALAS